MVLKENPKWAGVATAWQQKCIASAGFTSGENRSQHRQKKSCEESDPWTAQKSTDQ